MPASKSATEREIYLRCERCGEGRAVYAIALTEEGKNHAWGDQLICEECRAKYEEEGWEFQ